MATLTCAIFSTASVELVDLITVRFKVVDLIKWHSCPCVTSLSEIYVLQVADAHISK